jgi:hypothetical protein
MHGSESRCTPELAVIGRSGLGAQSDLIGTPEPMGIASILPTRDSCLLADVVVLVTQGNRDRPAGWVLSTPRSAAGTGSCGHGQRCGSRCSRTCRPTVSRAS